MSEISFLNLALVHCIPIGIIIKLYFYKNYIQITQISLTMTLRYGKWTTFTHPSKYVKCWENINKMWILSYVNINSIYLY